MEEAKWQCEFTLWLERRGWTDTFRSPDFPPYGEIVYEKGNRMLEIHFNRIGNANKFYCMFTGEAIERREGNLITWQTNPCFEIPTKPEEFESFLNQTK